MLSHQVVMSMPDRTILGEFHDWSVSISQNGNMAGFIGETMARS